MYWTMRIKTIRWVGTALWMGITGALILPVGAQSLTDFEKKVHEFTLDNGLKFLVLERHQAPVVSFHTYADVGSVDEVKGITGMAHVFEHMAFKGSRTVGTLDYEGEVQVLEKVDEAFLALKKERSQGNGADPQRLAELQQGLEEAQENASQFMIHDEFEEAFIRAGSVGLNASTSLSPQFN